MKILLVQTAFLGDAVLASPVIGAISALHPKASISVMTTPLAASLLKRDPLISKCITFAKRGRESGLSGLIEKARELRDERFDRVYSLHRSARTAILLRLARIPYRVAFKDANLSFLYHRTESRSGEDHAVHRNLKILEAERGDRSLPDDLRLFPPDASEVSKLALDAAKRNNRFAILVPGSEWFTKRWDWRGYREVASNLLAKGFSVLILGAPKEENYNRNVSNDLPVLDLTGKISFDDAIYLYSKSSLVVCNDSAPLHIASAFNVPVVSIFCATSPTFGFGPWKGQSRVVEKEGLSCKPCRPHGSSKCPTGTEKCMRDLEASAVIDAIHELNVI